MTKVVIIGAGSGFGSRLSIDILSREPLRDATIGLVDINAERLEAVARYIRRVIEANDLPALVETSLDRTDLLPGADAVITSVSVGGGAYWGWPFAPEIEIPRRYGVDQQVGDTIGPGGVFRFLRTGPVQLAFCRDVARLCPDALVINYTNPMAMLTWLHSVGSGVANVGLCHSVQGTAHRLADFIGVPREEVDYWVAGINHQAWFLRFEQAGKDLYPRLRQAMDDPEIYEKERVRWEMMRHFGYFVTESSGHNSEYVPYFRRTEALRETYGLHTREVAMEPREREWMKDTGVDDAGKLELIRSHEYASGIIEAMVTDEPFRFNGSVMNHGLIDNLPGGSCVEVPCIADRLGVHPCRVGALPPQCAALNASNIAVQELAVKAVLERDREAAFHAVALDPLTAATVGLDDIRTMFEEMWEAEGDLLSWMNE
jgi:alpha-galactosidase